MELVTARYPEEDEPLIELMKQSHACILLCLIKQHLKTVYAVTDSKFQNYSPNEAAKVQLLPNSFHPQVFVLYPN